MVKMVVKLCRLMGFLVEKEEEEDGGDGVVVVGMVEEMEERKVEELMVKVVEMEGRVAGQGDTMAAFMGCCWLPFAAVVQFLKEDEGNK